MSIGRLKTSVNVAKQPKSPRYRMVAKMPKTLKHVDLLVIVTMDTAVQFCSPPPFSNK